MAIAGRYELRRPLGHGAMAVVDLAHDRELDRPEGPRAEDVLERLSGEPPGSHRPQRARRRLVHLAVRADNAAYFGLWGLAGTEAKPMAEIETAVR